MNTQIEAVKKAAAMLREVFPDAPVGITIWTGDDVEVKWHGTRTYAEAVAWYRSLGIRTREKTPFDSYTQLDGELDGIRFTTFPNELPPTCKKVKITERVPKTQTVVTDEFVEVTREVVQCGPDPDEIAVGATQQPQPEPTSV